jgi:hypothetical protein
MLSSCSVHTLSVTVPAHTRALDIAQKLFHTRDCPLLVLNKTYISNHNELTNSSRHGRSQRQRVPLMRFNYWAASVAGESQVRVPLMVRFPTVTGEEAQPVQGHTKTNGGLISQAERAGTAKGAVAQ